MKKILILISILVLQCVNPAFAQNTQSGYVKERGRIDKEGKVIPGARLSDVAILLQGGNSTLSGTNGEFKISAPQKKYKFKNVKKNGFVLVDPELLSRQYSLSPDAMVIVLEKPENQLSDKLSAERKIRRTLQKQLQQKEDEIEELREQNRINEEEYNSALRKLYEEQQANEKLISEMADRYSRIDYDLIDDFNRRVSEYILNGELSKADSLLNTKGDIDTEIEELKKIQNVNNEEEIELLKRREMLDKSVEMAKVKMEEVALRCYKKYEIALMRHELDSALYYLDKRVTLDPSNAEWQCSVGNFVRIYIADFKRALEYYDKALEVALRKDEPLELALIYDNIGETYYGQGKYSEALEAYKKELEIKQDVLDENSLELALCYNNLGSTYYYLGDPSSEKECYDKVLTIEKSSENTNHPAFGFCYLNIANNFNEVGDLKKAEEYYNKGLVVLRNLYGEMHPDVANAYASLGFASILNGKMEVGKDYVEKALEIQTQVCGYTHPYTARILNDLGSVYIEEGDLDEALEYVDKAYKIQKEIFENQHPDLSYTLTNYGHIYYYKNDYEKALNYYKQAYDNSLFFNWKGVALSTNAINIGNTLCLLDENKEGLKYYEMAINYIEEVYGNHHPELFSTLYKISLELYNAGDYSASFDLNKQSLEGRLVYLDKNDPLIGDNYFLEGLLLMDYGKMDDSIDSFEKALIIFKKHYGENSFAEANTLVNEGNVYSNKGAYSKGLENYLRALSIYESNLETTNPQILYTRSSIGNVYRHLGEYQEALNYLNSVYESQFANDKESYDISFTCNYLGLIYIEMEDYDKALEYFFKSLEVKEKNLEPDHSSIGITYNYVSHIYGRMGESKKAEEFADKAYRLILPLGEENLNMADYYINKGLIYVLNGDNKGALKMYEKALDLKKRLLGDNHEEIADCHVFIAECYEKNEKDKDALKNYQKALKILNDNFEISHPKIIKLKDKLRI